MDNAQYSVFEGVFQKHARPLLERLRQDLLAMGFADLTQVELVDHDFCRGLGFSCEANPDRYVEFMLEDGHEYGFEGVGLTMSCSIFGTGQVWAPGNYTDSVSIATTEQLIERLASFPQEDMPARIVREWERVQLVHNPELRQVPAG